VAEGVTGEKIWLDGELVDWDDGNVHLLTHTLHYGLGVFEGIRCYKTDDGRSSIFQLNPHVHRLFASAHINLLEIPFSEDEVRQAIVDILPANHLEEGYIRPLLLNG
jgi:branched-chain amino acid aminotransferase